MEVVLHGVPERRRIVTQHARPTIGVSLAWGTGASLDEWAFSFPSGKYSFHVDKKLLYFRI
jgi:hypothetical protein